MQKQTSEEGKNKKTKRSFSIKKLYLKSKAFCKVTFRLPKAAAPNAETVTIAGDFNDWDTSESKLEKLKNGDFKITLELPCDSEYKFKYLIDNSRWENDWHADRYIPNSFGSEDSIVII